MGKRFADFSAAFPPVEGETWPVDGAAMAAQIKQTFGRDVPSVMVDFWNEVGAGYFAERELYLYGETQDPWGREGLLEWNLQEFWQRSFPSPSEGGPIMFGETCFGDQLELTWDDSGVHGTLLETATFVRYRLTHSCEQLLETLLCDRNAIVDDELLAQVRKTYGVQPPDWHYANIVSPQMGGSFAPGNYHLEPARVHVLMEFRHMEIRQDLED